MTFWPLFALGLNGCVSKTKNNPKHKIKDQN